jgi:hypothetical protein
MKRQVSFEKLGGWTSGVVRRSRPIVHTGAYCLAHRAAHTGKIVIQRIFP